MRCNHQRMFSWVSNRSQIYRAIARNMFVKRGVQSVVQAACRYHILADQLANRLYLQGITHFRSLLWHHQKAHLSAFWEPSRSDKASRQRNSSIPTRGKQFLQQIRPKPLKHILAHIYFACECVSTPRQHAYRFHRQSWIELFSRGRPSNDEAWLNVFIWSLNMNSDNWPSESQDDFAKAILQGFIEFNFAFKLNHYLTPSFFTDLGWKR